MGSILSPDDINVNDIITIHSHLPVEINYMRDNNNYSDGKVIAAQYSILQFGLGFPYKVLAINLPFISCWEYRGCVKRVFDTRTMRLMRLDAAYAASVGVPPQDIAKNNNKIDADN